VNNGLIEKVKIFHVFQSITANEAFRVQLVSSSDIVLLLIKKATEIEGPEETGIMGKKALQKALYFLNQDHNIFKFKWGDYGPLCGEIQQIVEDLSANGKILIKDIPTKKQDAIIKNMKFSVDNNPNFSDIEFPPDVVASVDKVTKFISGYKPRDLELLASVHYWAKKRQVLTDEYDSGYVFEKLLELKPDAGFTVKDVEKAIDTLEYHEYLKK